MIKRLVRMTFRQEECHRFLDIFEESAPHIRKFPGCRHLELWQDAEDPRVYMTYSVWDSLGDLDSYRDSSLFKSTWAKTKILFESKASTWTGYGVKFIEINGSGLADK